MKFLVLLTTLMTSLAFGQAPNVKGQDQGNFYAPNIQVPNKQVTKLNGTTALIETGNVNMVANAGFEGADLSNITLTTISGTCPAKSRYTGTSLSKVVDGKASALLGKDSLSSAGKCQYDITVDTSNVNYAGRMGVASFSLAPYNTSPKPNILPTSITAEVLVDGVKQTSFSNISFASVTSGAKPFTAYYTMGTTSVTLRITIDGQSTDSMQLALLDEVVLGLAKNNFAMFNMDNKSNWKDSGLTSSSFQGLGTVTNIQIQYKQDGPDLVLRGKFTTGTHNGSGVRINLPTINGVQLVSSDTSIIPSLQIAGKGNVSTNSSTFFGGATFIIEPSVSYVTMGIEKDTASGQGKIVGTSIPGSNQVITLTDVRVPIQGWTATTPAILGQTDTFSTDSANLFFKSTACTSSEIGCFNTYSYAANTNTRTLCTTAPTQTTSHMNTNGIQIFTRAYNAASTCASPAAIELVIGKGMKGVIPNIYKSTGKATSGSTEWGLETTAVDYGFRVNSYNENTGVLAIDGGVRHTSITTAYLLFSDLIAATSGYLVINASKSPVVMGQMLGMARYIVKTYSSGSTWYEIYNDCWVRQGNGYADGGGSNDVYVTYTFPIAMKDANWSGSQTMKQGPASAVDYRYIAMTNPTSTNFQRLTHTIIRYTSWNIEGYGSKTAISALGVVVSACQ